MKRFAHCCWLLSLTMLVVTAARTQAQVTSELYEASVNASLAGFDDTVDPPRLVKQKVFTGPIINTALDRSPLTAIGENEALGLVLSREDPPAIRLIVWDASAQSNLVTIAHSVEVRGGDDGRKGVFVALLEIDDTGGATHAFLGGFLTVSGSYKVDPEGLPTKLKGTLVGAIDGRVEGIDGEAILTKGKVKTAKFPLGMLVE